MTDGDGDSSQAPSEGGRHSAPMVCIGASAGGVRALQALFAALPEDTGAVFVVVMHLDPERESELPAILAARTRMPVIQVVETIKLFPNNVYVIPPDRE